MSGTDSSTGANFICTLVRAENPALYDQMEKAILSLRMVHGLPQQGHQPRIVTVLRVKSRLDRTF